MFSISPVLHSLLSLFQSEKVGSFYELFNILIGLLVGITFLNCCLFSTLTGMISLNLLFFSIGILKS